jgi:hypothetical protein
MFEVIDTGVGIEAHELKTLFQPFVQTSSGQKLQEGTGLGLSISYQFVRLMSGEMMVHSKGQAFVPEISQELLNDDVTEQVANGTLFRFVIPVVLPAFNQFKGDEPEVKALSSEPVIQQESLDSQFKTISSFPQAVSTENLNLFDLDIDRNWVLQLKKAILEGDLEYANHLIHQLKPTHASLAETLGFLIGEYQFDRILEAISDFMN